MFHFTIFAGSEARMPLRGFTAITMFGGAELKRPTLAEQIMQEQSDQPEPDRTWWDRMRGDDSNLVLTMFGATELRSPSLMEEYTALRSLVTTGTIGRSELAARIRQIISREPDADVTTFTLFGAFVQAPVGRVKQLKQLASGEKAGLLPPSHKRRLDEVVDAPHASGAQVLGELVTEMA